MSNAWCLMFADLCSRSRLIFRGNTAMNQSSEVTCAPPLFSDSLSSVDCARALFPQITATLDDELCRNAEHVLPACLPAFLPSPSSTLCLVDGRAQVVCVRLSPIHLQAFDQEHYLGSLEVPRLCVMVKLTIRPFRSSYLPALSHILHRCENMLESKAYLHWYARYGLRTEDMEEAIELLREWLLDASQFFGRWIRVVTKTDKLSEMR
eukprot:756370-Hanusia_phi.AAC.3